jgi:hypothetical protein
MPAGISNIWLPGRGLTDLAERRADEFAQEYDENLRFGRNGDTGQYCVFLIRRGHDPLPILGFDEVPSNDYLARRLYQADAQRRGEEILDEMNRSNESLENAGLTDADDAAGTLAEGFEWLMRTQGQTSHKREYMGNRRKNQMGGYS